MISPYIGEWWNRHRHQIAVAEQDLGPSAEDSGRHEWWLRLLSASIHRTEPGGSAAAAPIRQAPIRFPDHNAACAYAVIGAARRAAGRPIIQTDCQIAAIARSCGKCIAARSDADFAHVGIDVINS